MLSIKGIDISNWQDGINLNEVKTQGYEIVYIKATEGQTYIDPCLVSNYNKAVSTGLKIGFYHYLHSNDDGATQAKFFYENIKDKKFDCKLAIDIEVTDNQDVLTVNKCILDFANTIKQLTNTDPIIYTNLNFANNILNASVSHLDLWLAEYGVSKPTPTKLWGTSLIGWQYSENGQFTGSTDLNLFNSNVYIAVVSESAFKVGDSASVKQSAISYVTGQLIPDWVKGSIYTIQQTSSDKSLLQEIQSWVYNKDLTLIQFNVGDKVKIKPGATTYATGQEIPDWVKNEVYTVQQTQDGKTLLQEIQSWVYNKDLKII